MLNIIIRRAGVGHKTPQHGVRNIFHKRHHTGRKAGREDLPRRPVPDGRQSKTERQARLFANDREKDNVIQRRRRVGERGRDCHRLHFIARRQDHEHKQRIQGNIENASENDPETCCERPSLRAHQMRKQGVHRRENAAENDGIEEIPHRLVVDLRMDRP